MIEKLLISDARKEYVITCQNIKCNMSFIYYTVSNKERMVQQVYATYCPYCGKKQRRESILEVDL